MEDEQAPSMSAESTYLLQMLWKTTSALSSTTEDVYLDDSPQETLFDQHEILALEENLSESAPDLGKKSESAHHVAPQRLSKSADTLLTKNGKLKHRKQHRESPKCRNRFVSYSEFHTNREGSCKNRPAIKPTISVQKKVLHIGNLDQRRTPLDYTLCLADYKTNWDSTGLISSANKAVVRLSIDCLAPHIRGLIIGYALLRETSTGSIIAEFTKLEDIDRVVRLPLAKIFGTKVKSWRNLSRHQSAVNHYNQHQQPFQNTQPPQYHQRQHSPLSPRRRMNNYNCYSYRRYLIAPDIPDTVPTPEIQNALRFQGLRTGQVWRHMPGGFSIEVLRPCDYDRLCRDGVNFFNVAAFPVYPSNENLANRNASGMGSKYPNNNNNNSDSKSNNPSEIQEIAPEMPLAILQEMQHRENIQCFKCQRYGHKATHCKYWTRCVRCGGKHKVVDCEVSMTAASCCLCKGAHHAASHDCPVHNAHANAVQVTFAMARTNLKSSNFGNGGNIW